MPVTTPPSITALPAAPDPNNRATFNSLAYPWSAALGTWTTQVQAVASNVAANATDAASSATAASGSATTAGGHATNAGTSATLAQNWATQTGTPVSGGEYSAKYYALQAAAVVATIPTGTINDGTTSGTGVWSSSKVSAELGGKASAADITAERSATATLTNKTITAPTITGAVLNDGYTEEVFAVTGTTPALSPTNGSIQTWTLSANSTPTAGTWAAGQSMTLMVNDGTAFTITWTSVSVTWVGGTAPTLATSGFTVLHLWKVGSTVYGVKAGEVA